MNDENNPKHILLAWLAKLNRWRQRLLWTMCENGLPLLVATAILLRAVGAQEPQPTPGTTPQAPPTQDANLNGKWKFGPGFVLITQTSGNITATFANGPQKCPFGGQRANLIVDGNLEGRSVKGDFFMACATVQKVVTDCNLPPSKATKFVANIGADGTTIDGTWHDEGYSYDEQGGKWTNCKLDKEFDSEVPFSLTRCSQITLASADNFKINTDPKMPEVKARVHPDENEAWDAQITFNAPGNGRCSGGPDFNSPKVNGSGTEFTPDFAADQIFGGNLTVTATGRCAPPPEKDDSKTIAGDDPGKEKIQAELGDSSAPFDTGDYKRIACQESRQTQFIDGIPVLNSQAGNDAGIMQICYRRTSDDLWNWKTNIADGKANLMDKLGVSHRIPGQVRNAVVRGNGPFPQATDFTDAQLRMEAIQRYNVGTDPDVGYYAWDPILGRWVSDPEPSDYADSVIGQKPECP